MEEKAPYTNPIDQLKADLKIEIENLEQQRQQALETAQQATGAIALAQFMLQKLESDILTVDQFAEVIGGNGAAATVHPVKK